jgi:hypothetical protein
MAERLKLEASDVANAKSVGTSQYHCRFWGSSWGLLSHGRGNPSVVTHYPLPITHYPFLNFRLIHHDILMVATCAQAFCHNGGWRFPYLLRVSLAA